jgi:hypothetical protein
MEGDAGQGGVIVRFLLFLLALALTINLRPAVAQGPYEERASLATRGVDGTGELWFGPPPTETPTPISGVSSEPCGELPLSAVCDQCASGQLTPFFGYDSWRGVSDGTWQHNGLHAGANWGTRLGRLSEWTGIGLQAGGSAGVYDWSGTDYRMYGADETLMQGFFTYGLFRRATEASPWSAAVVQDWMFNDNFSVFGQDPTLSQWRGSVGYAINDWHEAGIWGAFRSQGDSRDVPNWGTVSWRAVNQLSAFWHAKWNPGGADTVLWFGVPEHDRLQGDGSLGDYFVGASASLPLSDSIGMYTLLTYLHPSASAGPTASKEDAWVFVIGLAFYPRGDARSATVRGQRWAPVMPVANNGVFLVDASANY